VKAFNYFHQQPMKVFANEPTEKALRREFSYVFEEFKYPGVPDIHINPIDNKAFFVGDIEVTPIQVWHHKMPVLGFRFGKFTYITDANRIDQDEKEKIKGSKIVVLNALRKEPHISHFSLSEAIALAQEIGAEQTYFTHISHQLGLHDEVQSQLPENIYLAYDGLTIEIN